MTSKLDYILFEHHFTELGGVLFNTRTALGAQLFRLPERAETAYGSYQSSSFKAMVSLILKPKSAENSRPFTADFRKLLFIRIEQRFEDEGQEMPPELKQDLEQAIRDLEREEQPGRTVSTDNEKLLDLVENAHDLVFCNFLPEELRDADRQRLQVALQVRYRPRENKKTRFVFSDSRRIANFRRHWVKSRKSGAAKATAPLVYLCESAVLVTPMVIAEPCCDSTGFHLANNGDLFVALPMRSDYMDVWCDEVYHAIFMGEQQSLPLEARSGNKLTAVEQITVA